MENFINETIDTTGLPQFEEVQFSKLQPSYWNVLVIHKILFFLFLGIALSTAFYFIEELAFYGTEMMMAYMILLLLTFVLSRIGFKNKGFAFRNHDVLFQHGIIATNTVIIPYNRVQHVALEQGPIARYFGLAKIEIFTAGGGISGDIAIPGIEKEEAEKSKAIADDKNPKTTMINTDFNQPQRQASVGMVIIFLNTIRNLIRAFFPVIIAFVIKPKAINIFIFFLISLGVLTLSAVISYLRYRNFTFYLDQENDSFVITEGILNKTKTTFQLSKIQQVNINQSLIQKIIGVYALELDTAGSNKKEGNIKAISHELALALKARLMENENEAIVSEQEQNTKEASLEKAEPFVKISLGSLVKLGITSNYLKSFGLLMVYFFTVSEYIDQLLGGKDVMVKNIGNKVDERLLMQSAFILFFFIISFVFVLLIINLARIVIKYFDYKISKQHGNLMISFGLLNTQSTIIKPERVQIVSVSRNYFQKKMNILQIDIRQALSGKSEKNSGTIEIPGCSRNERDEILKLLFQQIPEKGLMLKPNFRKLGFSIFLSIVFPLTVFLILSKEFIPELNEFIYALPIYVFFMGIFQFFRFRNYRLFIKDDFIIRQSGAWDITNEIVEWSKIQHITTSQLFWHKPLNIGSLILHTAGGNISFDLGDFAKMKKHVNWWLYKLETSDSNWM